MPRETGYQYLADAMKGYGVTHAFFVPAVVLEALVIMDDQGIVPVMTHGEKAAAYMADGYARASGRPGICLAQQIGSANLAAGLKDAYMACSPVIAITGGRATTPKHFHVYQEIDDLRTFDPVTKFNLEVDAVGHLPHAIRQAFREATSGAPRPVHIEFPGNQGQAIAAEADLELVVEDTFKRVPAFRPEPEAARVQAAAQALRAAQRPIIVAGGGVAASQAGPEVVALAEKLGIPVATSLNGKGTIREDHPLSVGVVGVYSRWCANRAVAEADLVFFIGSHTGSQVTNIWKIPPHGTPVIQLDIDPRELGRVYPNQVALLGDAKATLQRLIPVAEAGAPRTAWLERVQSLVRDWRAETAPMLNSDAVPIRPERLCRELNEVLPADALVVSDTGHAGMWTGQMLELTPPGQRYIRCAGSLGWGLPAAIGAKCALPDTPVVCFAGDGGLYYHIAELETAVRYGINVVVVVNNNQALNQGLPHLDEAYGGQMRGHALDMYTFGPVNLAQVAEAFGCLGIRVEQPAEIRGALKRAFAANRPVVVEVVSDRQAFSKLAWG